MTSNSNSNSREGAQSPHSRRCRQRVRFAENEMGEVKATYASAEHELFLADMVRCWWQPCEFSLIRENAHELVKEIKRGLDSSLEFGGRKSYKKAMNRVYKACTTAGYKRRALPMPIRKELEYWVNVGESRRGLEKVVLSSSMGKERQQRRSDVILAVLFAQEQCWVEGMSQHHTTKLIREASEKESVSSARFAYFMGAADATAAALAAAEDGNIANMERIVSNNKGKGQQQQWKKRKALFFGTVTQRCQPRRRE